MKILKRYKHTSGKGSTFWEAICDEVECCRGNPRLIEKWIDAQAESYLSKDWDDEWKEAQNFCSHCGRRNHKDTEDARREWAYDKANDDWECYSHDFDKDKDEEVAEFFGVDFEIESYITEYGDEYPAKEVIGICESCGFPFRKMHLFYESNAKKEFLNNHHYNKEDERLMIGYCEYCDEAIYPREIDVKRHPELKIALSL